MAAIHQSVGRRTSTATWKSLVKNTRAGEWAGLAGKLVGVGLFATLMYNYCNVLIEACIRGIH